MAVDAQPQLPRRPAPAGPMLEPRHPLGGDVLRAFETYFAAEQANLRTLEIAGSADPEIVAAVYHEIEPQQRRSLALLSFRVASLLPATPPRSAVRSALRPTLPRWSKDSTGRPTTTVGRHPLIAVGVLASIAAVAVTIFTSLGGQEPSLTVSSPIAPRVAEAATETPTPNPTSTPMPAPTPQPGMLERARIVAIYGHPNEPITGLLGKHPPEQVALEAIRLAREAEQADGRATVGALHVTVQVAQAQQTPDKTYLERLTPAQLQPWVDAAQEHGLLLILDSQIGWSDPLVETKSLEALLRLPFVHLALDPEFATASKHVAPGRDIGTLEAAVINDVQAYLGNLVRSEGLPRKMLMLHQFRGDMIGHAEGLTDDPDIEIVIDMDGFGDPGSKLEAYRQFALAPHAERPGIKLFFEWDEPILTPLELSALDVPPDVVIYQ